MINNYYLENQIIAKVNKNGQVIGKIEKWEAHKKGILHKAFSVVMVYGDYYFIQHRKHPAFDGVFDLTSSSHQLYIEGKLETTLEAAYKCLEREWSITKDGLIGNPINEGAVYYKAKDLKSEYIEHEVCEMVFVKIKKIPTPNYDFTYGFSMVKKDDFLNKNGRIYENLAPWIKVAIKKGFFN